MPLPCSPLYAFVADSIFHRDTTGLREDVDLDRISVTVPFLPQVTIAKKDHRVIHASQAPGKPRAAPLSVMAPVALKVPSPVIPPSVTGSRASFVPAMTTFTFLAPAVAPDATSASSPPTQVARDATTATPRTTLDAIQQSQPHPAEAGNSPHFVLLALTASRRSPGPPRGKKDCSSQKATVTRAPYGRLARLDSPSPMTQPEPHALVNVVASRGVC